MPIEHVSLDDSRLAAYRDLADERVDRDPFVIEGWTLLERALSSPLTVDSVLVSDQVLEKLERLPAEVPVFAASNAAIRELAGFRFHRGVLASVRRPPNVALEALAPSRPRLTLVICPHINDPVNLGSILRCCRGFEVDGVLLGDAPDPFSRRVARVSMGAAFDVPIRSTNCLADDLRWLQSHAGLECLATVVEGDAIPLDRVAHRPPRLGLLLGHEYAGLEGGFGELDMQAVTIPMPAGADSLNVGVAAGVFLYHLTRVAGERESDAPCE